MTTQDKRAIPVGQATLDGNEQRYVLDCLTRGWLTQGKYVDKFEREFADYIDVNYAVACSSGTAALHLALLALGVGPGDEVIVPSLTFVASANAIRYCGARPVFVDVLDSNWGLDPALVEAAITQATKVILPVHLYGAPVAAAIFELARQHHLWVVEDAAEGIGAMQHGRRCGSLGDAGCFSFYGNKTLTTGEGGMLTTNNPASAEGARRLRGQGQVPGRPYWHDRQGYNYRLTDLQAAVGCAQLERVERLVYCRQAVATLYRANLAGVMKFQTADAEDMHGCWMAAGEVVGAARDTVREALAAEGIETRPVFPGVHQMPMYRSGQYLPVTERLARQGLVLPTHAELSPDDVLAVCAAVKAACHA